MPKLGFDFMISELAYNLVSFYFPLLSTGLASLSIEVVALMVITVT